MRNLHTYWLVLPSASCPSLPEGAMCHVLATSQINDYNSRSLKRLVLVESTMSNSGRTMMRPSASHHCVVCNGAFYSKFSLKRHLGVKHNVDEEGRRLTSERLEYLRHQSDHRYIRNRERPTDNHRLVTSTNLQLQTSEVPFDAQTKHNDNQFALVDPVLLANICSQIKADDQLEITRTKTDSTVLSRSDDCHDTKEEAVRTNFYQQLHCSVDRDMGDRHFGALPVRRQRQQQHVQPSIPVRCRPSKNIASSKRQWICY
jgi:hypothetical protein